MKNKIILKLSAGMRVLMADAGQNKTQCLENADLSRIQTGEDRMVVI